MAKRITKAESAVISALLIIGMPVFLISKFVESIGGVAATISVLSVIAAIVWVKDSQKKKRLAHLRAKYSNELVVQSILNGDVWQGQTADQLLDSLGPPSDIDCKLLKTKSKDIWKYYPRGGNRYALRITVENGVVVGWDRKI